MKKTKSVARIMTAIFTCMLCSGQAHAQIWNKVKQEVKNRVENKVIRETGNTAEKIMDKAKDNALGTTKGSETNEIGKTSTSISDYKSYDFVPGDKIIFQPDLSGEADSELPARFIIKKGNAEIQSYEGEKILHLDAGGYVTVLPLMDNDSYLPEQFTVEFDMMYENDKDYFAYVNDFRVQFFEQGDENYEGYGLYEFTIISNARIVLGKHANSGTVVNELLQKSLQTNDKWHHIAIYVRKNIAKAYIDEYRVAASNSMPANAAKLAIRTDGKYGIKIKNVRIAAGGDDKYNKIVTDGKFVTHGILFDVNKSTIKPESMGALNEIVKLMKDHSNLSFEVQGHTDSDGNDDANMKLSQNRADAVKAQLVKMGIGENRLSTKGFGESKPMDSNDTAEGKANNRRVEFVKINKD
ncbi:MAG: OmpA family protein [Moheibacter sp.]